VHGLLSRGTRRGLFATESWCTPRAALRAPRNSLRRVLLHVVSQVPLVWVAAAVVLLVVVVVVVLLLKGKSGAKALGDTVLLMGEVRAGKTAMFSQVIVIHSAQRTAHASVALAFRVIAERRRRSWVVCCAAVL
jgi:hypothetical protein